MRPCRISRFLVIIILSALVVGCQNPSGTTGDGASTTSLASPVLADDVVSAEGVVVPFQQANLSFKTTGIVTSILVAEGDTMTAGQELARIDTRDLEQIVQQADARVKSTQAQLSKARATARPEEIASAQAAVSIANAAVAATRIAAEISASNVENAKARLAEATSSYKAALSAVDVAKGNVSSAQAGVTSAQASLNRLLNGPTELEIQLANLRIEAAKNQLWGLQAQRDALGIMGDTAQREAAEGQAAAAETGVTIAMVQLEQLLAEPREEDIQAARAQVAQAQAHVQTTKAQLAQAEAQVGSAQSGVDQAQVAVTIAEAQARLSETDIERTIGQSEQAQAQLDLLKAGARQEDIAIAEAAVAEAEAQLAAAQNALSDAVLRAPFEGFVGALMMDRGELVHPQMPVVRLGNATRLQIETEDLSEVDINQIQIGQKATISVDALDGKKLDGTVAQIAPIASDRRGDTVYTVLIDLAADADTGLRWGMSAFVEIDVD